MQASRCAGVSRPTMYALLNGHIPSVFNKRTERVLARAYDVAKRKQKQLRATIQHMLKKLAIIDVSPADFPIKASYQGKDYVLTPELLRVDKVKFACFVAALARPDLSKKEVWEWVKRSGLGG